jgi:hypothetical protein
VLASRRLQAWATTIQRMLGLAHPYDRQPEPQSVRKINNLF